MPFLSGPVQVEKRPGGNWVLLREHAWRGTKGDVVLVPAGFITDWASVPRAFTWLIPQSGAWDPAAVQHDFLCGQVSHGGPISRADADGMFRTMLRELDVPVPQRYLMWSAVRIGGRFAGGMARRDVGIFAICGAGFLISLAWVPTITTQCGLWVFDLLDWAST